jgi:large subunit ribosomal protein L28
MARVCDYCGKRTESGKQISRRGLPKYKGGIGLKTTGITFRKFKPNIQRVRAVIGGSVKRVKVCASCIKAGKIIKPQLKQTASVIAGNVKVRAKKA